MRNGAAKPPLLTAMGLRRSDGLENIQSREEHEAAHT